MLILHWADSLYNASEEGKLAPNWERPFRVKLNLSKGAYKLEMIDGKPIPRTWNNTHLRGYYVQVYMLLILCNEMKLFSKIL